MRVVANVTATFAAVHETFEQIKDQYSVDQYITSIIEVLVSIMYALRWDVENGTYNFMGLLLVDAHYVAIYRASFIWPTSMTGIYTTTLNEADRDCFQVKGGVAHKAR